MQKCHYCGTELSATSCFCGKCGNPVQNAIDTNATIPVNNSSQLGSTLTSSPNVQAPPPPAATNVTFNQNGQSINGNQYNAGQMNITNQEIKRETGILPSVGLGAAIGAAEALGENARLASNQVAPVVSGTPHIGSIPSAAGSFAPVVSGTPYIGSIPNVAGSLAPVVSGTPQTPHIGSIPNTAGSLAPVVSGTPQTPHINSIPNAAGSPPPDTNAPLTYHTPKPVSGSLSHTEHRPVSGSLSHTEHKPRIRRTHIQNVAKTGGKVAGGSAVKTILTIIGAVTALVVARGATATFLHTPFQQNISPQQNYSAPADNASFQVITQVQDPTGNNVQEAVIVTRGAVTCQGNGQLYTHSVTITGVTSTGQETVTPSCSGSYQGGTLTLTAVLTSDVFVFSSPDGTTTTCTLNSSQTIMQLSGNYARNNTFSGASTYFAIPSSDYSCNTGGSYFYTPYHASNQGNWTGQVE